MVLHAQVVAIFLKLDTGERLGEEVGDVEICADVPNTNPQMPHVVPDLEVSGLDVSCALTGLRVVHCELDRLVVPKNGRRCELWGGAANGYTLLMPNSFLDEALDVVAPRPEALGGCRTGTARAAQRRSGR